MRKLCLLVASAVLIAFTAAQAQDYPTRLIKLMHGFPPGGNVDVVARLMAQEMSKGLGQTILVESKPGQAGSMAAETIATNTEPDGYTILLVAGAHPAIGAVFRKLKYNPVDDFAWISTVSFYPFMIGVRRNWNSRVCRPVDGGARQARHRDVGHRWQWLDLAYVDGTDERHGEGEVSFGSLPWRGAGADRSSVW